MNYQFVGVTLKINYPGAKSQRRLRLRRPFRKYEKIATPRQSGRKALYGGRKKGRGWRRSSTGDPTDAVVESGAEEKTEMIRHHSGDHVFYLYITTTLCLLCVTDGLPIDEEVRKLNERLLMHNCSILRYDFT